MMPICNYKTLFGRCRRTAFEQVGRVILPGEKDGFGKDWEKTQYLCTRHANKHLRSLGHFRYTFKRKEG